MSMWISFSPRDWKYFLSVVLDHWISKVVATVAFMIGQIVDTTTDSQNAPSFLDPFTEVFLCNGRGLFCWSYGITNRCLPQSKINSVYSIFFQKFVSCIMLHSLKKCYIPNCLERRMIFLFVIHNIVGSIRIVFVYFFWSKFLGQCNIHLNPMLLNVHCFLLPLQPIYNFNRSI